MKKRIAVSYLARFLILLCALTGSTEAIELDWLMYRDPILPRPVIERPFPPKLVEVWLKALESNERDLQRRTAVAIAQAHSLGLEGLEATIEPLTEILQDADQPRQTRLAAAHSLVTIEARSVAGTLFAQLDDGDIEMAEVIEPALAKWGYAPLQDVLVDRLEDQDALPRLSVLAIRGVVALGAVDAVPQLTKLAVDPLLATVIRLEAATALGQLDETQSYDIARRLAGDKSQGALLDRLIAARVLKRHHGPTVETLLAELAADSQPAVQAIALGHMYRLSPDLVLPMMKDVVQSKDAAVRRWGARSLIARPSPGNLATLARLLNDRDPDLRRDICDALLLFTADEKWRDIVITQARDALFREGWREQEQATLLLVTLDDKTITDRLIELLGAERAEAHATAAWGLSRLQVPETAGPILKVLEEKTARFQAGDSVGDRILLQLAHLAETMGQLRHSPAKKVLEEYIPKDSPLPDLARCAAIWALGHLSENAEDADLINRLQLRMVDVNSMEPEVAEVRTMAAVSLGRLKAVGTLNSMRAMLRIEKIQSAAGYSCAWAIREFTGEPIPELGPASFPYNGWFLMPTGE